MAQAALAPSGPALDADAGASALQSNTSSRIAALANEQDAVKTKLDTIGSQRDAALSDLDKRQAADPQAQLKPPELAPMPQPKSTSPIHQWGSVAMTAALIGSLMTRQPLTTALNAAAGVMTAFRKNDQAAADSEFQKWKIANENYVKLYDYQSKVYERVIGDYLKQHEDILRQSDAEQRDVLAEFKSYAASFMDQNAMEKGSLHEVIQLLLGRERAHEQYLLHEQKLDETVQFEKAKAEMHNTPAYQQADARKRLQMDFDLMPEHAPRAYREAVTKTRDAIKAAYAPIDANIAQVNADIKGIKNKYGADPTHWDPKTSPAPSLMARATQKLDDLETLKVQAAEKFRQELGDTVLAQDVEDAHPDPEDPHPHSNPIGTEGNPYRPKTKEEARALPKMTNGKPTVFLAPDGTPMEVR